MTVDSAVRTLGCNKEEAIKEVMESDYNLYNLNRLRILVSFSMNDLGMTWEQAMRAINDPEMFEQIGNQYDAICQAFQEQCYQNIQNASIREYQESEARIAAIQQNINQNAREEFVTNNIIYEKDQSGFIYNRNTGECVGKNGYTYDGQKIE